MTALDGKPFSRRGGARAPGRVPRGLLAALVGLACRDTGRAQGELRPEASDAAPPWAAAERAPTPPHGMVWIPPGTLIAGTPPDRVPRVADAEMPGLQVVLDGFFIDVYAYPNEEGAIPETGVSRARAESLCAERGKRLCTELEWERACKGPNNYTYEYGDVYRDDACSTGKTPRMLPNGYRQGCRSEFGVRDMHGGIWEWTASRWGRGTRGVDVSVRGGNGPIGDLVGRCANAAARDPEAASPQVGFRCCKGPANTAAVALRVSRGQPLEARARADGTLAKALEAALPDEAREAVREHGSWRVSRLWAWRPTGNVELTVATGCAGEPPDASCGALIAQPSSQGPEPLEWVPGGLFVPGAKVKSEPRQLWIYSADRRSSFRRAVWFEWGRVRIGELQRRFPPSEEWRPAEPEPARGAQSGPARGLGQPRPQRSSDEDSAGFD